MSSGKGRGSTSAPPGPPPPPPSGEGRDALLSALRNPKNMNKLKKATTVDKSQPKLPGSGSGSGGSAGGGEGGAPSGEPMDMFAEMRMRQARKKK
jgi:hypothetical protein